MKSIFTILIIFTISFQINGQWSPNVSIANKGLNTPTSAAQACGFTNDPPSCPTYDVSGMDWYITAPDVSLPITIGYSSIAGSSDHIKVVSGFIEWEDPDGLGCINSDVINIAGQGTVSMSFSITRNGSGAYNPGYVSFAYKVNGGSWVDSGNLTGGAGSTSSWNPTTSGNTLEIRACSYYTSQAEDTRLLSFSTNKGALPVKWADVKASVTDKGHALINWSTASEINNDFFEIERSVDGRDFQYIGMIKGSGNTSHIQDYSFTDENTRPYNTYYYRIKQVDYDGKFDFSKIVQLEIEGPSVQIKISPNPVIRDIRIETDKVLDQTLVLQLISMNGSIIQSFSISSDQPTYHLDLSDLQAGIYYLKTNHPDIKDIKFLKTNW